MKKKILNGVNIFAFLLPGLALFIAILIAPIFLSGYYSFFKWNGISSIKEATFVGFDNYVKLFTKDNWYFVGALKNSLLLAAFSVFIQLPISLGLALILGRGIKGERGFLSVYFMPVLISTVVIGQLWLKIYNPDYGILYKLIGTTPEGGWIGNTKTALWAAFVPILWQYVGYHLLLMYAGVKSVSPELREAAKIDGATSGQVDWYIVIPSIKPIIKVSVIFAITGSLKSYDLIYVLTLGGPKHSTEVPSTLLFSNLFQANRYGVGSAIAVLLIILCFAFALLINLIFKEDK